MPARPEASFGQKDVLKAITFGHRIAEDEADTLIEYFVETDQWQKVLSGSIDVVYGPKGSGKSALYSLLRKKRDELEKRGVLLAACETIRGTPVFDDLVSDPPTTEEQFRGLWKLYFLSLIGTAFKLSKTPGDKVRDLVSALEDAHLVESEWSLRRSLRAALDCVRRIDSVSGGVKVSSTTGQPEGVDAKRTISPASCDPTRPAQSSDKGLLQD